MGRRVSPSLAISWGPLDVLSRTLAAQSPRGGPKNALFIELLRDHADGVVPPRAEPPPFDPSRAGGRQPENQAVNTRSGRFSRVLYLID
jgi:hypothetical protein